MKIGMLVDTYLPILGGAEVHVLELSRALSQMGYDVSICTAVPDSPTHPPGPLERGGAGVGGRTDSFPVVRLPGLKGGSWRALLHLPEALPGLVAFVRQVDIVHCHYSFLLAALGTLLGRVLGKPSAVTLHGLGTLDSSVGRSPLYRLYRYISLKLAGTIIATSQEMRDVALRFAPPERIVVIPNGVDTVAFSPAPPASETDEVVILSMRRLAPKNGVQYLVEAAPEVIEAVPQARFWVAGEGKLEAHIRRRVGELGIELHFVFLGIVAHENAPQVYNQADIVVFPSSAESTSLACLEAMCTEKAIVASGLTAYQEMLGREGERGVLVALFDREDSDYNAPPSLPQARIHALAQAIIDLAGNPQRRSQLGQAARRFAAEHYDWTSIAAKTARIYSEDTR